MYVRDVMTTDVITITSNTSILEARRIMDQKNIQRLPVVDDGKLVGVVNAKRLERTAPHEDISNSMWDVAYNLVSFHGMPVKQVMQTDVVTVSPGTTVEEAVGLAESKGVGSEVVVENGKVVGIVTTTDLFKRIVDRVLGIGDPGCRIEIVGGAEGKVLEEIISIINKHDLKIITLHVVSMPGASKRDIVVHVDSEDVSAVFDELRSKGYKADVICRYPGN